MVQTVDKAAFEGVESIEPGMMFEAQGPDGAMQRIVVKSVKSVKSVEGDEVIIDASHPLAGVVLHFDVEIVSVREASEEETAHGHVH